MKCTINYYISRSVRICTLFSLAVAITLPTLAAVRGTVFLRLDFNEYNAGVVSPTNSTFQSYAAVASTGTTGPTTGVNYSVSDTVSTTGTLTVSLASGASSTSAGTLTSLNRSNPVNSGVFTYGAVYQDFVRAEGT